MCFQVNQVPEDQVTVDNFLEQIGVATPDATPAPKILRSLTLCQVFLPMTTRRKWCLNLVQYNSS